MTKSPFLVFRIPGSLERDGIRLRPLRISDSPVFRKGLNDSDILVTTGLRNSISRSCFAVWSWLRKTYTILFCIEVESKCIGFIGLYNLEPGESAEITLVIFDGGMRGMGYGSRAYTVVATILRRSSFAKRIIARVKTDNIPSLSFWKKLGFEERSAGNGIRTLAKDLR